jgi:predicted DNA-binding transcriptional regulator AlpA
MSTRINKGEVMRLAGLSEAELRSPSFPRPVMHGGELFWYTSAIMAWLALPRAARGNHWSARA